MRRVVSGAILVSWAITASVQAQHPDAGTTAFPFLNMGYDARSVAMGGASVAMPNGVTGVLSNPAALAYLSGSQMMIGYRPVLLDVWSVPMAFARATSNGVFAGNAIGLSGGDIEEIVEASDGTPIATGNIARCNYATGGLSWARQVWQSLAMGITAKGMYNYIGTSRESFKADAFAVDAGTQYRFMKDRLIYGFVLKNVGFMRRAYGSDDSYPLPLGAEVGVSYVPRHIPSLRMALDLDKTRGDYLNLEPGVELQLLDRFLALRLGYLFSGRDLQEGFRNLSGKQDPEYQKSNWSSVSGGAGISTEVDHMLVNIDMALELRTVLGPTVVVTGTVGF